MPWTGKLYREGNSRKMVEGLFQQWTVFIIPGRAVTIKIKYYQLSNESTKAVTIKRSCIHTIDHFVPLAQSERLILMHFYEKQASTRPIHFESSVFLLNMRSREMDTKILSTAHTLLTENFYTYICILFYIFISSKLSQSVYWWPLKKI